ncbi:MAG: DNA alkylation repair protein [archaeon]
MSLQQLKLDLSKLGSKSKAKLLSGFFKTGKGEYGEGDIFIGVTVPNTRKIAIKYKDLSLKDIEYLLSSKIHEERLCALLILVHLYEKHSEKREEIFNFYLKNTKYVNNWDLVDLSSHHIIGDYLLNKNRSELYRLANSNNLWEKRIAVISTFNFIRNKDFSDSIKLSELLLQEKHDLMHKAVGWMLREIGKRDINVLKSFLAKHYKIMPRTMLRYSIEKFPESERKKYLKGEI